MELYVKHCLHNGGIVLLYFILYCQAVNKCFITLWLNEVQLFLVGWERDL